MKLNQDAPPAKGDETYPKGWPREYVSDACTRFGARFRIAKGFKGVSFSPSIGAQTAATYSSLIRFGVVYSAYESFIRSFGSRRAADLVSLELRFTPSEVLRVVDAERKPKRQLLGAIAEFVTDRKLRDQVHQIISGQQRSAFVLAEAVRHAYVHGHLTASPSRSPSSSVKSLVDVLSDYLLLVMEESSGALAQEQLERIKRRANQSAQTTPGSSAPLRV